MGKAPESERFARSLDAATLCSLEWAVTVRFYAALHYVQAYFASQKITFRLHTNRASAIARDAWAWAWAGAVGVDERSLPFTFKPAGARIVAQVHSAQRTIPRLGNDQFTLA